jgi:hypothetical protein
VLTLIHRPVVDSCADRLLNCSFPGLLFSGSLYNKVVKCGCGNATNGTNEHSGALSRTILVRRWPLRVCQLSRMISSGGFLSVSRFLTWCSAPGKKVSFCNGCMCSPSTQKLTLKVPASRRMIN